MKQLYTILLMLLACCSWVSCGSDKSGETFNVKMDVTALGEDKEYTLKDFADATDEISLVSTQPSWVTVTYATNENNQWVIKVSVEENTESDERQHQVMILIKLLKNGMLNCKWILVPKVDREPSLWRISPRP